jgi:PleD family two-component response regulator
MGRFGRTPVFLVPVGLLLIAPGVLVLVQQRRANLLTHLVAERDWALDNAIQRLNQVKSQLSQLSNEDPVTHLLARHVVIERFQLLRTQARRYGTKFGIALISLTDFMSIAERVGTEAGGRLLASLGSRLVAMTRESDTVGFM